MSARFAWLPFVALAGCAGSGFHGGARVPHQSAPPGVVAVDALPFTRFTEVPVVIGAAEEQEELRIGAWTARREGPRVRCSDGRLGPSLAFEDAARGIRVGEHTYHGRLVLEPHPRRGLRLTEHVDLERYVRGVVARELVLWSAQHAELEAQAIAVRTYALCTLEQRRRTRPAAAFLFDGVEDQAYGGEWAPADSAGARRVAARLRAAIEASRGQVLTLDGQLLDARFHAACGGATATLEDVFPRTTSRSPGRPCAPCAERALAEARADAPDARRPLGWSWTASSKDLARAALHAGVGGRLLALEPLRVDESGRWREVQLRGPLGVRRMPFEDLRALLGRGALKSGRIARTWPRAGAPIENGLRFDGYGRGHGVGLCQEGARDHAERGWDARRILAHYYPTAHVTRLPAR